MFVRAAENPSFLKPMSGHALIVAESMLWPPCTPALRTFSSPERALPIVIWRKLYWYTPHSVFYLPGIDHTYPWPPLAVLEMNLSAIAQPLSTHLVVEPCVCAWFPQNTSLIQPNHRMPVTIYNGSLTISDGKYLSSSRHILTSPQ